MAICFNKIVENVLFLSICKKFGNGLPGLNSVVPCNPGFTWVRDRKDTSNAENLVYRIHTDNSTFILQGDNMSWNTTEP